MRRTYAALLCFVWLLGIEVLPNLHLALHDARPHTHAADGTIIVTTFDRDAEPHRHADGTVHSHAAIDENTRLEGSRTHAAGAASHTNAAGAASHTNAGGAASHTNAAGASSHPHARHRRSDPGVLAFDHAPDSHSAAGLAHHATALHPAAPPVVDAVPVDRVETISRYPRTGRSAVAWIATRDARGPPSA